MTGRDTRWRSATVHPKKFYHLVLVLLAVWLPLHAHGQTAREETAVIKPPPRTIDDITRLLDHYKPDVQEAAQARADVAMIAPATDDRRTLFEFYRKRAAAHEKIGAIRKQMEDLRKALEYAERSREETLQTMMALASAETTTGNLQDAIKIAEQMREQVPRNLLGLALSAESLLVFQYAVVGDFESARALLREVESSLVLLRRSPRWGELGAVWTTQLERARGQIYAVEGNLPAAERAFRLSMKSQEDFLAGLISEGKAVRTRIDGARRFLEVQQRSLANVLLRSGKIVEAEILARRATQSALERVGRGSTDSGQGLTILSRIIGEQGRYAEAEKLASAALVTFETSGALPETLVVVNTRKQVGSILASQGRHAEAITAFRKNSEAMQRAPELVRRIGTGDLDWVLAMLHTGDQKGAREMAAQMLADAIARYGEQDVRAHAIRAFHAMALAAQGAYAEAKAAFEKSVPALIAQAQQGSGTESGTLKRQQRLIMILESYIRVLSELGASQENAAASFRLADTARSSAVQRALTASAARASIRDPKLADLARREQDTQGRVGSLSDLLTQLLSAPPEQQLPKIQAKIATDIATLKREREQLQAEIAQAFPDYAELVDPKPVTPAQVQKALRPGETLLSYYFGADRGYVWALRADGTISFATIPFGRQAMAARVAKLRGALDPQVASIGDLPAFDLAAAHELYLGLVQPVAPALAGSSLLLVVPHGELGQLPLALLPTAPVANPGKTAVPFDAYRDVPWLMRKLAIEQLPSVTSLASLRRLPAGNAARRSFIGFGDPLFSKEQGKEAPLQLAAGAVSTRGLPLRLRNVPKTAGVSSAELALLPRLPDTGQEISEIARVLKAEPGDIYLQGKATEKAVIEGNLANRRVVMFATHGLVPGELDGLTQPALALTTPDLADGNGDGLLAMDEILSLRLDADWVVLSACNTAAGDGAGAEAVSGLGRAFFYAGARALLVSNWPVETASARLLMTDLFRRQVENPALSKAEALRQAMLALADGPGSLDAATRKPLYSHAHPLFWAPFVIVGD